MADDKIETGRYIVTLENRTKELEGIIRNLSKDSDSYADLASSMKVFCSAMLEKLDAFEDL